MCWDLAVAIVDIWFEFNLLSLLVGRSQRICFNSQKKKNTTKINKRNFHIPYVRPTQRTKDETVLLFSHHDSTSVVQMYKLKKLNKKQTIKNEQERSRSGRWCVVVAGTGTVATLLPTTTPWSYFYVVPLLLLLPAVGGAATVRLLW